MRSMVILDALKDIQPDEEVTAKQIVQWIIGALEVTSELLPDFTISAEGKVSSALFDRLCSETAKVEFPFQKVSYTNDMDRVVEAVGRIFDVTNEKENSSLQCWMQIGQFLNDLQKHCKNALFVVISSRIGVMLLKKMIAIPNFDANTDIIGTMLLCYECGLTVARESEDLGQKKTSRDEMTQYMNCCDEFFALIGENLIFSSDAFFPLTTEILTRGRKYGDAVTKRKYWEALHFALLSNDQTAKANMATFLMQLDVKNDWFLQIAYEKSRNLRKTMLSVLKALLQYSRNTNVPLDIDWPRVFVHTLNWHIDALDLFIMYATGEEQDKDIRSRAIAEKAVEVYLRHNDMVDWFPARQESEHVLTFRNLVKGHVDFVTCEKLFYLLRKHVSDRPAMCAVLILFIDSAAKTMSEDPHFNADYVSLVKTALKHLNLVKPYPELMCRLIKIFNITDAMDDNIFSKEIMSILPEALHRCNSYGTTIELLEVLKVMGYKESELMGLFETVVTADASGNRTKENLALLLALHDVFYIFKIMNPEDRTILFLYFKRKFRAASGDEKVLYATVMIHMVATFHSTPERFVGEAWDSTEKEASLLYQYLSFAMEAADKLSFASVHLGIAICVYHGTFDTEVVGRELLLSLQILAENSIRFRLNYELDAQKSANINDLRLLRKFWRAAIAVFKRRIPDGIIPSVIFEWYPSIEIHLVAQAEEFLSTILQYGDSEQRYQLFAVCVTALVLDLKLKKVNPIVNKLFNYIATSEWSSNSASIASIIFLRNLGLYFENSHQPKVLLDVQKNLYKNHLTDADEGYRKGLMGVVSEQIDACRLDRPRRGLEKLRQCLQPSPIPNVPNVPEPETNRDEVSENIVDSGEESNDEMDRGDESNSLPNRPTMGRSERRSDGLPVIYVSITF